MKTIIVLLLLGASAPALHAQQRARMGVDPAIPTYKPLQAVQGSLTLIGVEYLYLNKAAGKPLPPLVREFLTFGLSQEGQKAVAEVGFVPLPADVLDLDLKRINK